MDIPVLYEDADVLVLNKPAGLLVHADGRSKEPTLADWLRMHYPETEGVGEPNRGSGPAAHESSDAERSGIVHRLDRETSGVLVVGRNQTAFIRLKKQFQRREVQKTYHACVYGRVKHDDGVIDRPIARSRRNPVLWSATRGRKGKEREAVTEYRVLHRGGNHTFLELFPLTGRTHQIRVHLKAINYPVVCDKLYAPSRPCELGFSRLALHSRVVSFVSPTGGQRVRVEAPYPPDFENALAQVIREEKQPLMSKGNR